ncbi:MAG: sugar ABC transporter ATP-binding protein [Bacillota bacterium]
MAEPILQMKNISKSFPGVQALKDVDFNIGKGEVHALVGENGAGKSTLMKVLTGVHPEYEGQIILRGEERKFTHPRQAQEAGLAIIHQELELVSELTAAENIFLGREPGRGMGVINFKKMKQQAQSIFTEMGLDIDVNTKVSELTIGRQQMVEIAKAISQDAEIIAMDEPTSSLSQQEVEILFDLIRELKDNNIAVIYISHHLEEIFAVCDRVTVLRDGKKVAEQSIADTDRDEIVQQMVGRNLDERFPDFETEEDEVIFSVENLTVPEVVDDVSFQVHQGEIFGLAGLMGAGRSEIARAICGLYKNRSGRIYLQGKELDIESPRDAISQGVYYLTENRKEEGLIPALSVGVNISLSILEQLTLVKGVIAQKQEKSLVEDYISRLDIRTPGPGQLVKNLSGGNQQKVVLARVLSTNPKVIIMDEPTRGIDVGAKQEIYNLMRELVKDDVAIIFISSELPELLNLATRIGVIYKGGLQGILDSKDASQESIMQLATGGS